MSCRCSIWFDDAWLPGAGTEADPITLNIDAVCSAVLEKVGDGVTIDAVTTIVNDTVPGAVADAIAAIDFCAETAACCGPEKKQGNLLNFCPDNVAGQETQQVMFCDDREVCWIRAKAKAPLEASAVFEIKSNSQTITTLQFEAGDQCADAPVTGVPLIAFDATNVAGGPNVCSGDSLTACLLSVGGQTSDSEALGQQVTILLCTKPRCP